MAGRPRRLSSCTPLGSWARDGDRVVPTEAYDAWAEQEPPEQFAALLQAWRNLPVEYVATSGNRTVRTLSRLMLDPPCLEAWCHLRNAERVFSPSRIHSVMSFAPDRERGAVWYR
ncbi:hypothetical protein ACH4TX_09705 [Streptomyces sp. NPDC021098]|uniref:hypothetical protein n=1 Tax=unclassified Streptomyces TaxID=2593676 RepID=UPI0037907A6E